jgi:hypothetical protein
MKPGGRKSKKEKGMIKKLVLTAAVLLHFSIPTAALAYDDKLTHPDLTKAAVQESNLDEYLEKSLGIFDGLDKIHKGKDSVLELLRNGSENEDLKSRAFNHFWDPIRNAGLDDPRLLVWQPSGEGNMDWAMGYEYEQPNGKPLDDCGPGDHSSNRDCNDYSWRRARSLFYEALTSTTEDERNQKFVEFYEKLGRVLHLLQDMGVPAHTRNDFLGHVKFSGLDFSGDTAMEIIKSWYNNPYEFYVKEQIEKNDTYIFNKSADINKSTESKKPVFSKPEHYWDNKVYEGVDVDPWETMPTIDGFERAGLAEYSNANFLSLRVKFTEDRAQDDRFFFPYPKKSSVKMMPPESVMAEDGIVDFPRYLYKDKDGELIPKFALAKYLFDPIYMEAGADLAWTLAIKLDEEVHEAYATYLIPKTVGYSAGLIDFFFRGSIEITDPDINFNVSAAGFDKITLYAENTSPEGEDMTGGTVSLVVKYKIDEKDQYLTIPAGPRDEHDEFQYIVNKLDENHSIPRITDGTPDPVEFQFNLIDTPIPLNAKEIYLYLVYRGDLGDEQNDAVAVGYKDISPRKIEIGLPDTGVYALTDADPASIDPTTEGFDSLTLFAKNIAPDEQTMDGGSIQLVVKYRVAQEDQFQMPAPEPPDEFHYIVKDLQGSHTISKGTPVQFDFDLSTEEIPLWATDVYLYLIYKGKLGLENDSLCVGFKDISEPTPLDYYNSEDKICLENQYYDAGSDDAIAVVDVNNNGIADRSEWDVYAHDIQNIYIRYSPLDDPQYVSLDAYNYKIEYLGAGDFTRLFVLSDYKFNFNASDGEQIKIDSRDDFDHYGNYVGGIWSQDGLTNQVMVNESGDTNYDPNTITYIRTIPWFDKYRNIENKWFVLSFDNTPYPEDSICTFE